MSKLTKGDPTARELVTEILEKASWWNILNLIVQFLRAKDVDQVRVEFGFVLKRDLNGKRQAPGEIVQLSDLTTFIQRGLDEGTIEWEKGSDFCFYPLGTELAFMLCNDSDLHLASTDSSLLLELAQKIAASGIKVYDSGRLI
jgi:hypothetical protein